MLDLDPTVRTGGDYTPDEPPPLGQGQRLARYTVLDHLGAGGMGTVYAAYDPSLDRKVALKLLLAGPRTDSRERTRLLREAKALAQLSHPNVVAVHDVGMFNDQVFVAMEFVEGHDLRSWLDEGPRSWEQLRPVFTAAGAGLVAAHAAGIVHRDFKPANVLVGSDGRVRVADFGLAVAIDEDAPSHESGGGSGPISTDALTQTGMVMGTPAYMPPEQASGQAPDARADQYAFCVTLYEALYGHKPFTGASYEDLARAKTSGRFATTSADQRSVPSWLRRVIVRGLSPKREDRYRDMSALLVALGHDPRTRRTRWALGAGVLVLIGGAAAAGATAATPPAACDAVDRLEGVWDPAVATAAGDQFEAVGRSYGAATWQRAHAALDTYATAWVGSRLDACEATHLRREQSERVLDLRVACLDQRKAELGTLTELFAGADPGIVARASAAIDALTPLDECNDTEALVRGDDRKPRSDPAGSARAAEALGRARSLHGAGRFADGLEAAQKAVELAQAANDEGLHAAALVRSALLLHIVDDDPAAAEAVVLEAIPLAAASGRAQTEAIAWTTLMYVVGVNARRPDEALHHAHAAKAAVARLGDELAPERVRYHKTLGNVLVRAGRHDDAVAEYERALELAKRRHGERSRRTAQILGDLADVHHRRGKLELAQTYARETVAMLEDVLGPAHPSVADRLITLGMVRYDLGHSQESLDTFARALEIRREAFAPGHPQIAGALNNVAIGQLAMGRHAQARASFEEVLEMDRASRPDDPRLGQTLHNIGAVHLELGEYPQARARYLEALAQMERALGPEDPSLRRLLESLGVVGSRLGRHDEALAYFDRSLMIWRSIEQTDHPAYAAVLTDYAAAQREAGQRQAAEATARDALDRLSAAAADPRLLAQARFELAKTLWAPGRVEARGLLKDAVAALQQAGPEHRDAADEISRWWDEHERGR